MEDAVKAIEMAFAVLVFVIALSVSFSMFSKAKATADSIATIQDTQKYLETSEAEDAGLYVDSTKIGEGGYLTRNIQRDGYRVVDEDDVYSTIYRYSLEKYGVTIMKKDGTIITRFDSNTENLMRQWDSMEFMQDESGNPMGATKANKMKQDYSDQLRKNIATLLVTERTLQSKLTPAKLEALYKISGTSTATTEHGAPWTRTREEIFRRISAEINGKTYIDNSTGVKYNYGSSPKNLKTVLHGKQVVEIVNEIDNNTYLKDTEKSDDEAEQKTDLLQNYEMPTIEVVYIIQ